MFQNCQDVQNYMIRQKAAELSQSLFQLQFDFTKQGVYNQLPKYIAGKDHMQKVSEYTIHYSFQGALFTGKLEEITWLKVKA